MKPKAKAFFVMVCGILSTSTPEAILQLSVEIKPEGVASIFGRIRTAECSVDDSVIGFRTIDTAICYCIY